MSTETTDHPLSDATDEEIKEAADCYGLTWNPEDANCTECAAFARCMYAVALGYLKSRGEDVSATGAKELSEELGVSFEAARYVLGLFERPGWGLPKTRADGLLAPSWLPPPKAPEGSAAWQAVKEIRERPDRNRPEVAIAEPPPPTEEPPEPAPEVPEPAPEIPEPPPAAAPPKQKYQPLARQPDRRGGVGIEGTDEAEYCARLSKDLERPYIMQLPVGHVMSKKDYTGRVRQVKVTDRGYLIEGLYFPTLYAAMMEIDGYPTIGNKQQGRMSAKRFFGLNGP